MHQHTGIIVYANNQGEALNKATEIMKEMTSDDGYHPFDWFTRPGRWDCITNKATSSKGKETINHLMSSTWREFQDAMKQIRFALPHVTDEEVFEERGKKETTEKLAALQPRSGDLLSLLRHYMGEAGRYRGLGIYLYDNDGEGIRRRGHLQNVLDRWKCLPESHKAYANLDVWIVTFDCHN